MTRPRLPMSDDLRTLAQAVVSAYETYDGERTASVGRDYTVITDCRRRYYAACKALGEALDDPDAGLSVHGARAILAALDAAYAQGYARAMVEVVERADHSADYTGWSDYALGHRDAHERLAVWARERLPAAAERD